MLPDRVSNPGPLTYKSGALPIALRGPANWQCSSVTDEMSQHWQCSSVTDEISRHWQCSSVTDEISHHWQCSSVTDEMSHQWTNVSQLAMFFCD